jgi:deoxyhypusine synthase
LGGSDEKGIMSVGDATLREIGINRIFDAYIRDEAFEAFESKIGECFSSIDEEKRKTVLHPMNCYAKLV